MIRDGGWRRIELDAIVLMALRKEPARRYASAAQMSEDVQRYLDRRPVLAHPDGWGYRTARFMRRNRLGVAVAAAVALFLGGATIVAARESRRRALGGQADAPAGRLLPSCPDLRIQQHHQRPDCW
jgi:hypothetical protein